MAEHLREDLRNVLLQRLEDAPERWALAFPYMGLAALRFSGRQLRMNTKQRAFAKLLQEQIRVLYGVAPIWKEGKEQSAILVQDEASNARIRLDIRQIQRQPLPELPRDEASLEDGQRREDIACILAQVFLACGSLAQPDLGYQLEFAMRRATAAKLFQDFFASLGLSMRRIRHQGYHVLYCKDGDSVSLFLRLVKADPVLLAFEDFRAQKELYNHINRALNCDTANAQRLVDSSVRQRQAIRQLMENPGLDALPEALAQAAKARLRYPGHSLEELGATLRPPLGKSGMHHRLQKLLRLAEQSKEKLVVKSGLVKE